MAVCNDHCSKNGANCGECGGSFLVADPSYSQTALLEGKVVMLSAQEMQAQSPQEAGPGLTTQAAQDSTGAFLAAQDSTGAFPPAWFAVASSWWLAVAGIAVLSVLVVEGRNHGSTVNLPTHALG
jgi:hypothetical protein